jgi:uncharacterized protein (TIGR03663 family)
METPTRLQAIYPSRKVLFSLMVLVVAGLLRFAFPEIKPVHFDEGINGFFVDGMNVRGHYVYDPTHYHGPLPFYAWHLSQTVIGRSALALRLPNLLVGMGVVALALVAFRPFLNRRGSLWFALFLAVSPGVVFYSRTAIHEIWFLFFLLMAAAGFLQTNWGRLSQGRWLFCLGIAGMILVKETWLIHLLCFPLAWVTAVLFARVSPERPKASQLRPKPPLGQRLGSWIGPVTAGLVLLVFFYTSTLTSWRDLAGIVTTFGPWFAVGFEPTGHEKPWPYWLQLFLRYEWLAVVGILLSARFLWPARRPDRWVVILGAGTLVAYTLIPYKTPWCAIVLVWPFFYAAGHVLGRLAPERTFLATALPLMLVAVWTVQTVRLNFFAYDDPNEPYVYVQTYRESTAAWLPLVEAARRNPALYHVPGVVLTDSSFPLPWLWGDFRAIGYWNEVNPSSLFPAQVIITEKIHQAAVEPHLRSSYFRKEFRLRSGMESFLVYYREDLWAQVPEAVRELAEGWEQWSQEVKAEVIGNP